MKLNDDQKHWDMIRSTIRMQVPLNKQSEVLEILESVRERTQFEPDCIYTRLYRGNNEVEIVMFEELWKDEQELLRHLKSDIYQRVLLAIEMADRSPEVRFEKVLASDGFETIKKAIQKD